MHPFKVIFMTELTDALNEAEFVTNLAVEEVALGLKLVQLRKQMIDNCPGCPGPSVGSIAAYTAKLGQLVSIAVEANAALVTEGVTQISQIVR
jgi:hypothetical protein